MTRTLLPSCGAVALLACAGARGAEPDGESEMPTVVVTGSRIPAEPDAGTAPVTIVNQAQLAQGGNDSLGKALQALPHATGGANNTNVNNGGDGATRIDLRGLGAQRTVILLNGRRLPNGGIGGDSSVDIDSLPLSMIERVEVLSTGASAVYGADAIGGVINVITRRGFDGMEAGVQGSQSDRGDGGIGRAHALAGIARESTEWSLGMEWVKQRGITMDSRAFSANPSQYASAAGDVVPFGPFSIPDGRFAVMPGNALGLAPGAYARIPGSTGQGAAVWRPATAADTFNYAPYAYLQTPNERGSLWLLGTHRFGDDLELYVEGTLGRRESSQQLAPAPFMLPSNAAPVLPGLGPHIPANNYYNPFGVPVIRGARRLVELGSRDYEQRVDVWRALAGLRGRLGEWRWEFSVASAGSDAVTRESGAPVSDRVRLGVGPSGRDASGRIVCGTPDPSGIVPASAVIEGCVPIDMFGGAGSITPEQIEYVSVGQLADDGSNSQRLATLGIVGDWGSLPAGPIQWAFGAEYQRVSGAYRYDSRRISGLVGAGPAADIPGGSYDSREAYVEMRAPLLAPEIRVGSLDAVLGARFSDFSTFGSQATWRGGLRWAPTPAWIVRVDYATLFRAPSLAELYQRQVSSLGPAPVDPCGVSPTPEQRIHCEANGVPPGYVQVDGDFALTSSGGDLALQPEEGHSLDAGIEFRSIGDSRWNVRADFFQTRLDDFIDSREADEILAECAAHGTQRACARIERRSDGSLDSIDLRQDNLGLVRVRGLDVGATSGFATSAGDFEAHVLVTRLLDYETQIFEGGESRQRVGYGNLGRVLPKWRAQGSLVWKRASWGARYTAQWIGAFTDCNTALDDEEFCGNVPSVVYHDLEISKSWPSIDVQAGITNLTDEQPPFLPGEANTSAATYRLLGRLYFLRANFTVN